MVVNQKIEITAGPLIIVLSAASAVILGFAARGSSPAAAAVSDFITVFFSILLEAFPFILLGTLISSAIHLFVTPAMIARFVPRGNITGLIAASIAGFAFPICECANVPVTRRLLAKGLPVPTAVTFLLAVAIVNPVVLFSTWIAFGGSLRIVLLRGLFGMGIAILIGWIMGLIPSCRQPLRDIPMAENCDHGHNHSDTCDCHESRPAASGLRNILSHTGEEFYAVGRYMITGAAVASLMQTLLPRGAVVGIGANPVLSVVILMALAYSLSLCSEADAFIAATFAGYFTPGAVVAFLVYGPMMDIKNTLMLLDGFKPKFIITLVGLVTAACLAAGLAVNLFLL
jgi:hypothetical protein